MKVLVLGGTGAMGVYLVKLLSEQGHEVIVTSRKMRQSSFINLKYVQGDAHDNEFLKGILKQKFDVVVDFMVYNTGEFKARYRILLDAAMQYIFFSSARVYADSKTPIKESSPRLLDVCKSEAYLATDEYAMAKARQENLLMESGKSNWTIIRPYITYSNNRLQLGVLEKELWLQRALRGRCIIFNKDIAAHKTTLTFGENVSQVAANLVGNRKACGKTVHITGRDTMLWGEVLEVYLNVLEHKTGNRTKVLMTETSDSLKNILHNQYQVDYDRMYDRVFDNSLANELCGEEQVYTPMKEGLARCLEEFIDGPQTFLGNSPVFEAWADKHTRERTSLVEFSGVKNKLKYFLFRL